jgi:hypothetical protein
MIRFYIILLAVTFTCTSLIGQVKLPVATNFKIAYHNHTRDTSGKPGKLYWQNKASYTINVTLDPATRKLSGKLTIDYVNNSPDTLRQIIFKLYPNLYQSQAMRNMPVSPDDLTNGVHIQSLAVNNKIVDSKKQATRGTNMFLRGITVLPGKQVQFEVAYDYQINKTSFIRTGQVDSGAFMVAYFFPRVAVYDDIDGWNDYPYIGKEEFYNDFCDFDVNITLPGNYQCWATGNLTNTNEVYEPKIAERIKNATNSDSITNIITVSDIQSGVITKANSTNTWSFKAENVTDFAFAISNHYIWKASSVVVDPATKRRTRVDAVYNPQHKTYEPVINYARKTVELISYKIPGIPFPYPHETIFDGLDAMEYPMMVNNLPFTPGAETIEFTAHEIFHTLLPFFVGTNETKYSFMDEGWATFSEFTMLNEIDPKIADYYDISDVNNSAGIDQDVPIMTLTPQLYGKARFSDKDLKPALGFRYIKEMLGDQLFYKAFNYYIKVWQGKHPTPYDFFSCMNDGARQNLNWFWQNWFFEKNTADLAIKTVKHQYNTYLITILKLGDGIVPIHLTISYNDGSIQTISRSIACWQKGNKSVRLSFNTKKTVKKIVLGSPYDVEADSKNNIWNN